MTDARPDDRLLQGLDEACQRFRAIDVRLSDPETASDPDRLRELGQERAELEPVVSAAEELEGLRRELSGARTMAEEAREAGDEELETLARGEIEDLEARHAELLARARRLLVPADPLDDRPAIVEVRAGAGGDEAGLFASDLLRMYRRFSEGRGWRVELMDHSEGIPGATREAIVRISGRFAYGFLRHESGVHRVQRVPRTESQGRIHTSAATVAVLPEAEPVDIDLDPGDLRIDVFRSSGPGGQSVNTTDSAVRITHEPTGLVVTCQDEKSQHRNRDKAMSVLRSRLLDRKVAERQAERSAQRKAQVGTGDRSAKIRTYNFPQNRVTDHRIGLTLHSLDRVLDGELDELVEVLREAEREERLREAL